VAEAVGEGVRLGSTKRVGSGIGVKVIVAFGAGTAVDEATRIGVGTWMRLALPQPTKNKPIPRKDT